MIKVKKNDSTANDCEKRAADSLISELERRILSGALPNDMPLPSERELVEEFNASRTVVREAIAILANRGLVETKPRFRPKVRKPDFQTVIDATDTVIRHLLADQDGVQNLYQSRLFIERGLVRAAALGATRDDISQLKTALAHNYEAIEDTSLFYQTDIKFHGLLYNIPKNPVFPAMHKGYSAWLAPSWAKMERSVQRNEINYQAHKKIYDAILERDADRAEQALEEHLSSAWQYVKNIL
jgi:DNA-binding FadR family transcriptional regulator